MRPRIRIAILLVNLLFFSVACSFIGNVNNSLHRLEKNGMFQEAWEITNMRVMYNNRAPMVSNSSDMTILEGYQNGDLSPSIIGIDSKTGEIIWKVEKATEGDKIVLGENVLYRGTVGFAEVFAYDIKNGDRLWRTLLPLGHSVSDLFSSNGYIFTSTSNDRLYVLDETGRIIRETHNPSRIYLQEQNIRYVEDGMEIKAVDNESNDVLWSISRNKVLIYAPVFQNDMMIIDTAAVPPNIMAIEKSSGTIKWQVSEKILSNICTTEEEVYLLDIDGYLITLDIQTGIEVSRLLFSPTIDPNINSSSYFIACGGSDNAVIVSFGDNWQISALRNNP